jgi:hypothetical protein
MTDGRTAALWLCPWSAHGLPMVCPWFAHGLPMTLPMVAVPFGYDRIIATTRL